MGKIYLKCPKNELGKVIFNSEDPRFFVVTIKLPSVCCDLSIPKRKRLSGKSVDEITARIKKLVRSIIPYPHESKMNAEVEIPILMEKNESIRRAFFSVSDNAIRMHMINASIEAKVRKSA